MRPPALTPGPLADWQPWCPWRPAIAPPVQPELDDVIDPYQRKQKVYEDSFGQILPAARTIARAALRM